MIPNFPYKVFRRAPQHRFVINRQASLAQPSAFTLTSLYNFITLLLFYYHHLLPFLQSGPDRTMPGTEVSNTADTGCSTQYIHSPSNNQLRSNRDHVDAATPLKNLFKEKKSIDCVKRDWDLCSLMRRPEPLLSKQEARRLNKPRPSNPTIEIDNTGGFHSEMEEIFERNMYIVSIFVAKCARFWPQCGIGDLGCSPHRQTSDV